MRDIPETMRTAADRVDELLRAGRVPPALAAAMRALAVAGTEHIAECMSCRTALARAGTGSPVRTELCPVVVALWEELGQLGSLVVNPDTAELGPLARRVES